MQLMTSFTDRATHNDADCVDYDGELTMHGMWRIGWISAKWLIKVVGHAVETDEAEIPEWRPVASDETD